jgi:hypothetical protein
MATRVRLPGLGAALAVDGLAAAVRKKGQECPIEQMPKHSEKWRTCQRCGGGVFLLARRKKVKLRSWRSFLSAKYYFLIHLNEKFKGLSC